MQEIYLTVNVMYVKSSPAMLNKQETIVFWTGDHFMQIKTKAKGCKSSAHQAQLLVLNANSLDLDETPSNSTPHPDSSCLTLRQHFHQI